MIMHIGVIIGAAVVFFPVIDAIVYVCRRRWQ